MSKFTIEVGNDQNCNFIWGPSKDLLRGRYQRADNPAGVTFAQGFSDIPDLPGMHITIDSAKMEATIHDPLNEQKNIELLATFNAAHKATFNEQRVPVTDKTVKLQDKDQLATWIFAAMRLIESKLAELKSGSIPKELPGEPEKEFYRAVPKVKLEPNEV